MNVIEKNKSWKLESMLKATETVVTIKSGEKAKQKHLKPPPIVPTHFIFRNLSKIILLTPHRLELHYDLQPPLIKRSFENPDVISQNTLEKTFLKAKDAQRYRDFTLAEKLLHEIIEDDPLHLEARKELSSLFTSEMVITTKHFQFQT